MQVLSSWHRDVYPGAVAGVDEGGRPDEPLHELPDGNAQPYILWQAEEACRHASNAAVEEFIARMDEVLDKRSDSLTRTNISTMFHRCAKVLNATIQARTLPSRPRLQRAPIAQRQVWQCPETCQNALPWQCWLPQACNVALSLLSRVSPCAACSSATAVDLRFSAGALCSSTATCIVAGSLTLAANGAQAELARTPHMEERIADIPALVPLLERLTALALPVVHMLDPMSVSNIFWALGTLRLNPAGQPHTIRAWASSPGIPQDTNTCCGSRPSKQLLCLSAFTLVAAMIWGDGSLWRIPAIRCMRAL